MPYLDDVLNPYQSLTGDLTSEDTLTGLLSEDGLLQGALAISDVVGVTQLTELTDVSITNPINNDVLTYNDVTEKWENMPAQGGGGGGTSDYEDLDNKPSINSVTLTGNQTTDTLGLFSGDYDDLTNKPELATVATTGDYDDLTGKPTIPAAQVNSDWNASSGVAEILNKPTIPTSLDDLSDVDIGSAPTMDYTWLMYNVGHSKWEPRVYQPYIDNLLNVRIDSTLTDGQSIVYNQVSNKWINANFDYSKLSNKPSLATVATSGDYDDLLNKPTIPTVKSDTLSDCTTDANGMVTNYYPSMTNRVILNALKLRTVGTGTNDYVYITFAVNSTDTTYLLLAKNRDGSAYANKSGFTIKYWYIDI